MEKDINLYIFRIDLENGILICDHRNRGNNRLAPSASSIMSYAFEKARECKNKKKVKIQEIVSYNIENEDTNFMISEILKRKGWKTYDYAYKLEVNSKEAISLLASPNLKSCIWLACDFGELFEKREPKIITLRSDYERTCGNYIRKAEVSFNIE